MLGQYNAMALCPSVGLSVCLTQAGVLSKRLAYHMPKLIEHGSSLRMQYARVNFTLPRG